MRYSHYITLAAATLLTACGGETSDTQTKTTDAKPVVMAEVPEVQTEHFAKLVAVLANQPDDVKIRYGARNPGKTLEFFGLKPGMTVAEALPGGGWYTKILAPYIGETGKIIGVDYDHKMWPEFGRFGEDFIEGRKTWPTDWTAGTAEWTQESDASISAFTFGNRNTDMDGQVDAVLFIRALHNLARFEEKGGYLTTSIADTHAMLKPGGLVGVVQHEAPEQSDDTWAGGSNGYLKKSAVIAAFETAGFELQGESDMNANPKDQPTTDDIVWRLPPSLSTSGDNAELKARMEAIGESNRMTLLFKKPS